MIARTPAGSRSSPRAVTQGSTRLLKIKISIDRTMETTVETSHSLNVGISVRIGPQPGQRGGLPSRMRCFIVSVVTFLLTTRGPHASLRCDEGGVSFRSYLFMGSGERVRA